MHDINKKAQLSLTTCAMLPKAPHSFPKNNEVLMCVICRLCAFLDSDDPHDLRPSIQTGIQNTVLKAGGNIWDMLVSHVAV